jgi:hypothetical protein
MLPTLVAYAGNVISVNWLYFLAMLYGNVCCLFWPDRLTVIVGCAVYAGWLVMLPKLSAANAGFAS